MEKDELTLCKFEDWSITVCCPPSYDYATLRVTVDVDTIGMPEAFYILARFAGKWGKARTTTEIIDNRLNILSRLILPALHREVNECYNRNQKKRRTP